MPGFPKWLKGTNMRPQKVAVVAVATLARVDGRKKQILTGKIQFISKIARNVALGAAVSKQEPMNIIQIKRTCISWHNHSANFSCSLKLLCWQILSYLIRSLPRLFQFLSLSPALIMTFYCFENTDKTNRFDSDWLTRQRQYKNKNIIIRTSNPRT